MSSGEHAAVGRRRDLVDGEAVEPHQPVGLVEPVLAQERRRRRSGSAALASGIGLKAE